MSEKGWYCPNCGPDAATKLTATGIYTVCQKCDEYCMESTPPFVAALTAAKDASEARVGQLESELSKVNNEFGSATADWPDAWRRVAELKSIAGARYRALETLKARVAVLEEVAEEAMGGLIEGTELHKALTAAGYQPGGDV